MKLAHVAVLCVRLVAFYFAVLAAMDATSLAFLLTKSTGGDDMMGSWALGTGITIALQCLLAGIVYAYAPRIAGEFSGEPSTDPVVDRYAIGQLAFRIAGVLIVNYAFYYVPQLVEAQWFGGYSISPRRTVFITALLLAVVGLGVLLYWRAGPLARRVFATTDERDHAGSTLAQAIGFSLVGVWFVAGTFPELVERATRRLAAPEDAYAYSVTAHGDDVRMVEVTIRFLLGLGLFMSGGVLARVWHRLRTAGLPAAREPERARSEEARP